MITGIVLAAGLSSRMGSVKQLALLGGSPLLQHAVDRASAAGLDELIVVLGHAADEIERAVELPPGSRAVRNPDYRTGQASSLRAGLQAAAPGARAAVVLLGDQPDVSPSSIGVLVDLYRSTGARAVRSRYGSMPGHPVLLDRSIWPECSGEEGDRGAGAVLDRHPEWVVWASFQEPHPSEVDSPADLDRIREASGEGPAGPLHR